MEAMNLSEVSLHLKRLTPELELKLTEMAKNSHWEIKDYEQLAHDLNEFIRVTNSSDPELYYLLAKLLFFNGSLDELNDLYTLVAAIQTAPGLEIFYALGLAFQGYSSEAMDLLREINVDNLINDPLLWMETKGIILYIHSIKRDYRMVKILFDEIISFSNNLPAEFGHLKAHALPWALLRQAYSIRAKGEITDAMALIARCNQDLKSFPHRYFQIMLYTLMGHCLHNAGKVKQALGYYDQAIDLGVESRSSLLLSILYNRVGMAMTNRKQIKSAKEFFEKALNTAKDAGAKWLTIGPLVNLVRWKLADGQVDEAINDYHSFVDIAEAVGDEQELCYALIGLAELYEQVDDIPKSKFYLSKGIKLGMKLGIFEIVSYPNKSEEYN